MESHNDAFDTARAAASAAIVESPADKKLIVAGPGTGKTFTFRQALTAAGGRGLALSFIRNLVADLRAALDDVADVFTFHGFCKHQLHRNPVPGLSQRWHYYPPLLDLIAHDLTLIGSTTARDDIERALHNLDHDNPLVAEVLRLGSYYDAVSHTDIVYRVLMHFASVDDAIPEYPLIVVDEYQDFSELETTFIDALASKSDVLVAGDDDQALYHFKNADARFIRELAADERYERFELPYCSRCTAVVVGAVNAFIEAAIAAGNLEGRLDKPFECFVPDKQADSERYPAIRHAVCSVQSRKAPYVGRYIVEQIDAIPHEDIEESQAQGYPTVLVVGPNPFLDAAFEEVARAFPQAIRRKSEPVGPDELDAYRLLAADESSRLGWRILIACDPFPKSDEVLADVTRTETELAELVPDDYRERHLELARMIAGLGAGEALTGDEEAHLTAVLGRTLEALTEALARTPDADSTEESDEDESAGTDAGAMAPSILATSLIGSKGLSAGHVFIVGVNDGHLPRDPSAISDSEICQFLVGLSRTRKACHLVSVRNYGGQWLEPSRFAKRIAPFLDELKVDKAYFAR